MRLLTFVYVLVIVFSFYLIQSAVTTSKKGQDEKIRKGFGTIGIIVSLLALFFSFANIMAANNPKSVPEFLILEC